ncbi:MAG: hypothetical protein AB7Y46_03850 [Armatimonadota bacterium]
MLELADALSGSLIYADLLVEAAASLRGGSADGCPCCRAADKASREALNTLLGHIASEDVLSAYRASDGLCLRHLRQAAAGGSSYARLLTEIERERLQTLARDCEGFVAASDYRRIGEPRGPHALAWRRAARKIGGGFPLDGTE